MSKERDARYPSTPQQQTWAPRTPAAPDPQPSHQAGRTQGSPPSQIPHQGPPAPHRRKRRRVFFWVFLAVQILFLIWVIAGISSGSGTSDSCEGLTGDSLKLCEDAGDIGTTIGVGLVVGFWVAADFILGLTYVIYRLASRQPRA